MVQISAEHPLSPRNQQQAVRSLYGPHDRNNLNENISITAGNASCILCTLPARRRMRGLIVPSFLAAALNTFVTGVWISLVQCEVVDFDEAPTGGFGH